MLPSVVQINTSTSTGSGVVYDGNGDIVTNAHVVGTAQTVQVQSSTGNSALQAKVIGAFAPDDLAVIRVTSGAARCARRTSAAPAVSRPARSCWRWAARSG